MTKTVLLSDLSLRIKPVTVLLCSTFFALLTGLAWADDIGDSSFLPVWQMMNREQKEQFVAGYIQGMKDAAKMTEVLSAFVKDNPASAGDSLQRLKGIYLNLGDARSDSLTHEIDTFYASPKNKEAPLSRAITGARNKL